jgi:hypothetical protein
VPELLYTLILEDDVAVDPRKYGPLVQPALGVSQIEARMAVRKGRGIFLEKIAESQAHRILAELEKDGIRTRAVKAEDLPALPPLLRASQVEFSEDFLTLLPTEQAERIAIPWEALGVVHAGAIAKPQYKDLFHHVPFQMIPPIHKLEGSERDVVRENLILKMGNAPERAARKKGSDVSIFEEIQAKYGGKVKVSVDLVTADLGTWLRVSMDDIGYLRRAGTVKLGEAWGFQMLLKDLRERCAGALSEMTLKLLGTADIREAVFPAIEEYNRYVAWVAIKRSLWPTAADSSSPSPEPPASPTDAGSSSAWPGPEPPSTSS